MMLEQPLDYFLISIILNIISCLAAVVAIRVAAHRSVNAKYIEQLKHDLDKRIYAINSLLKSPLLKQVTAEIKNPNKVYCKQHGWVYPIVLPDGSLLCPYLHRLYPFEEEIERSDSVKIDVKGDEVVKNEVVSLEKQIKDVKERLKEIENKALTGTQIISAEETREEKQDLF